MRTPLQPVLVCLRFWPQLAACYLLGLLGRRGAIEFAAWAGQGQGFWADLWPSLIMPLAGIARLGSYVAMFFVIRPGIPALAALPRRSLRGIDVFATVVVPFVAIYLAWQMFREDWLAYEASALNYSMGAAMTRPGSIDLHPESLPVGAWSWIVIGAALLVRYLLSWFKDRLPGWFIAVRIYVDTLWVFLVLTFSANQGLTLLLNPGKWVAERRIVVWFNDTKDSLFAHVAIVGKLWDGLMWAVGTVFGGAAVPLIWLAVAGIVYGAAATPDWRATARRVAGARASVLMERAAAHQKRVQTGWKRVPDKIRREVIQYAEDQIGKFKPITDSARLLLHGGVVALSLYVLAYLGLAWLDMAGSFYRAQLGSGYLMRGMAWLLGPHSQQFWNGTRDTVALVSHVIIEPLRICLVATTLGFCVSRVTTTAAEAGSSRSVP
ncbi:hypothetical protein [Mycolicibacterium sp.]|uniref:hypothetical protein n=1 Tax=Mycolicibacterium sp. TaxID=2320850 RepID=UPI003D0B165A